MSNYDRRRLTDVAEIEKFVLAGNSTFTLVSKRTGERFTYKVTMAKDQNGDPNFSLYFVKLLTGPDNEFGYSYLGLLRLNSGEYRYDRGAKSRIHDGAPSHRAFRWFWGNLMRDQFEQLEFWHEGRCGRCGRKLTVPESVESGFGPECINHV